MASQTIENAIATETTNVTSVTKVGSGSGTVTDFFTGFASKVDLTGMPEKFFGHYFKRWQQRMKIWLTTKGLLSVILSVLPSTHDNDPRAAAWREKDEIGKGVILLGLSNTLFDVYCKFQGTAKDLWDELDKKYNTEDNGLEKYAVSKFLKFEMKEGKSVTEQTHEFQLILHSLREAEMELPEKFQVMSIIEKFPKTWEDFGMTLKHKREKISMKDLMHSIAVEEEHRNETKHVPVDYQPKAHMVTGGKAVKEPKNKQPVVANNPDQLKAKPKIAKKPKANKPCWNCGQMGHWASWPCPNKKAKAQAGGPQVNMVTDGPDSSGLQLEEQ